MMKAQDLGIKPRRRGSHPLDSTIFSNLSQRHPDTIECRLGRRFHVPSISHRIPLPGSDSGGLCPQSGGLRELAKHRCDARDGCAAICSGRARQPRAGRIFHTDHRSGCGERVVHSPSACARMMAKCRHKAGDHGLCFGGSTPSPPRYVPGCRGPRAALATVATRVPRRNEKTTMGRASRHSSSTGRRN